MKAVHFEDYVIAYCPACQTGGRALKDAGSPAAAMIAAQRRRGLSGTTGVRLSVAMRSAQHGGAQGRHPRWPPEFPLPVYGAS